MIITKQLIAGFNRGAETYNQAASLQAKIAKNLAAKLSPVSAPTVLEIGCGTGLLSEHLVKKFPQSNFLLTDIAPAMLEQCRNRLVNHSNVAFNCVDGEALDHLTDFDLIVSSMTLHWFNSLNQSLQKIKLKLLPSGRFLFAMLTENSFCEWREIYRQFNYPIPTPSFPAIESLRHHFPEIKFTLETIKESYPSAQAFLQTLKTLGAVTPQAGYVPLTPDKIRNIMRRYNHGIEITYEVVYGEYHYL